MSKTAIKDRDLLTREALEKLNTKRLLAYRDRLYSVPTGEYYTGLGLAQKEGPAWLATMANIKEILDTREHITK